MSVVSSADASARTYATRSQSSCVWLAGYAESAPGKDFRARDCRARGRLVFEATCCTQSTLCPWTEASGSHRVRRNIHEEDGRRAHVPRQERQISEVLSGPECNAAKVACIVHTLPYGFALVWACRCLTLRVVVHVCCGAATDIRTHISHSELRCMLRCLPRWSLGLRLCSRRRRNNTP